MVPAAAWPPGRLEGRRRAGEVTHARVVLEIALGEVDVIRAAADQPVRVELEVFAGPDGAEHPATVRLTLSGADGLVPGADDLTLAEAEALARGLLEAVRLGRS